MIEHPWAEHFKKVNPKTYEALLKIMDREGLTFDGAIIEEDKAFIKQRGCEKGEFDKYFWVINCIPKTRGEILKIAAITVNESNYNIDLSHFSIDTKENFRIRKFYDLEKIERILIEIDEASYDIKNLNTQWNTQESIDNYLTIIHKLLYIY